MPNVRQSVVRNAYGAFVHSLTVADVLRLIAATDDAEDHLRKLFEWQIERVLTVLRLVAAGIAAILVVLLTAVLRDEFAVTGLGGLAVWVGLVFSGIYLADRYSRARTLEREYVAALGLLREFAPLIPLLRLYEVPDGG